MVMIDRVLLRRPSFLEHASTAGCLERGHLRRVKPGGAADVAMRCRSKRSTTGVSLRFCPFPRRCDCLVVDSFFLACLVGFGCAVCVCVWRGGRDAFLLCCRWHCTREKNNNNRSDMAPVPGFPSILHVLFNVLTQSK